MPGNDIHSQDFFKALNDYYYLINRDYPGKQVLKTVGDRYKLSGAVRTLLFRGVFRSQENLERSHKITRSLKGNVLHVDFYNSLFTFLNYKLGKLVFISTDKLCRDSGSLFGKIKKEIYFTETTCQLLEFLSGQKLEYIVFYIDSPVSFSKEHKAFVDLRISEMLLPGETLLSRSADNELKKKQEGIVCSTDSAIIDSTKRPIADLSYMALNHYFNPELLDLSLIIEGTF